MGGAAEFLYQVWLDYQVVIWVIAKSLIVLCVGIFFAFFARKKLSFFICKKDEILGNFVAQVLFVVILILSVVSALGTLGVQTSSIIAVLGTAGLAIALALKSSLSSLASGIMLIVLRPFKKGDIVEIGSIVGRVEAINLFQTTLRLADNKLAIFPNEKVSGGTIVNCTNADDRRIEWVIGVGYQSDIEEVKSIILGVIAQIEEISKERAPFVGVSALNTNSIDFSVRVWVNKEQSLFGVKSRLIELTKQALDEAKIVIPYNQLDVHLYQN